MKRLFVIAPLFCLFFCNIFAKNIHNGSIRGLVSERETNLEISSAIVRLAPIGLISATNELGQFSFNNLAAGDYVVSVSCIGFETMTKNVRVEDSETTNLKFSLHTADIEIKTIEVAAGKKQPLSTLSSLDIHLKTIQSAQDILRFVPGIVIAQHAGGGKAEQIFLRGFDIDHGTDIALSVDEMPVNMVSHAHGQGYADLHFVIPEMVERVDFQKGVYDASVGNFGTAGAVKFHLADAISSSFLKFEGGEFGTARGVSAVDLLGEKMKSRGQSAYLAGEYLFSNGYFESPQDFTRANFLAKYRGVFDENRTFSVSFSQFSSRWNASGQIPERAIRAGQISRFGAIDNNEGGETSRQNLTVQFTKVTSSNTFFRQNFGASRYRFELYSNFTFFLNDSVNGDQIRQKEHRDLLFYSNKIHHSNDILGKKIEVEGGIQMRFDQTDGSELSRSRNRVRTIGSIALGNISELNAAIFADAKVEFSPKWTLNLGGRVDQFRFGYQNKLDSTSKKPFSATSKGVFSPKMTVRFIPNSKMETWISVGRGFHSNDARSILGGVVNQILPQATGVDAGFLVKPTQNWLISATYWQLGLAQEFVYVGDEGIVEAGGRTFRRGFDFSTRLQMAKNIFFDADYTYARGRSVDDPDGQNRIPLAPEHVGQGGFSMNSKSGFGGALRTRYVGDRAANADNSLVAKGYFLLDGSIFYKIKNWELTISAQNILNSAWKEAQFETESRLQNESESVTEIHFTPGTPRFLKAGLTVKF
jgi:outer membrane receptor protein involved in Fe transport